MRAGIKPQVNIDKYTEILSRSAAVITKTAKRREPKRQRTSSQTSANEQNTRKPARSVPGCRHMRNVPSCRHLGTILMCRPLGTALVDSIVGDYLTAPARRRLRRRRPGHRPWRSQRANCRCGHHPPHTPARHPQQRHPRGPRGANPRQPSPAADDQR